MNTSSIHSSITLFSLHSRKRSIHMTIIPETMFKPVDRFQKGCRHIMIIPETMIKPADRLLNRPPRKKVISGSAPPPLVSFPESKDLCKRHFRKHTPTTRFISRLDGFVHSRFRNGCPPIYMNSRNNRVPFASLHDLMVYNWYPIRKTCFRKIASSNLIALPF